MDELVQATSSKVRGRLDLVFSNTICFVAKYCVFMVLDFICCSDIKIGLDIFTKKHCV